MKDSKLYRLARKWLPIGILVLQFFNQVVELVSKAVNYVGEVSKFFSLIPKEGKAGFRPDVASFSDRKAYSL